MKVAVVVDELRPSELAHARAQAARLRQAGFGVVGLRRRPADDELGSVALVHAVGRGAWRSARRLARRRGAPIVYDHPPGAALPRRLGRVDGVVAPGPVEAGMITARAGTVARLAVVPPAGSNAPDRIKPRLRQRLGSEARTIALQETTDISLSLGKSLVRAVSSLADVDLVFLGGDTWRHRLALERVAEEVATEARVHFVGGVPRKRRARYLAQADIGLALGGESRSSGRLPAADVFGLLGVPFVIAASDAPNFCPSNCVVTEEAESALAWAIEKADRLGRLPVHDAGAADLASLFAALAAPLLARGPSERGGLPGQRPPREMTRQAPGTRRDAAAALLAEARGRHRGGDTDEAIRLYREIATGPHSSDAVAAASAGLARLSATAASAAVERVMQDPQRSPLAVARAAEAAAVLGDLTRARAYLDEVLAEPNPPQAALRTAIRVLERSGEPRAALRLARRAGDETSVARILGTLDSYDPTWLPAADSTPAPSPPRPDRALVLLETSLPHVRSGYTYRAQTLLRAQREAGLEPVALTRLGFPATRGLSAPPSEDVDGVMHHRTGLPGVQSYTSVPVSRQLVENVRWAAGIAGKFRPEAIVATTPHLNGLVGLALGRALGVPVVYDVRGFPEMTWAVRDGGRASDVFGLRRIAETRCMREAAMVTTLSETMRQQIIGRGIPPEKVFVLPHAVDTEAFAPAEADRRLGTSLGLTGRTIVGYISSLVPYEGVGTLLEAIDIARRSHPEVAALIVGDGESLPALEAQARRMGLDGHVVFTGRVEAGEIARYYSLMDVFACPREDHEVTRYVTPLKPFEAMAAGSCLAVSDLPTLREAVRGGKCGALFPAGDAEALAATVCRLVDRPEERRALMEAAREHAVANHGLDRLRAQVEGAWGALRRTS